MGEWHKFPVEIISEICMYLPRRDRLACSLVCKNWRKALEHGSLWKNVTVHMDTDLVEPSTMLLMRQYYKYLTTLELGWAYPQCSGRWLCCRHQELTKRAVRFILILTECCVQLKCIKIFDWFDIFRFKKIVYHLTRFLRTQMNLTKIILHNANLHKLDCIKLLAACLGSKSTITYLDIHNYYYYQTAFDSVHFLSCIEQMSHLQILKLDYFVLSRGVIEAILVSDNHNLCSLEVSIAESDRDSQKIADDQWKNLKKACPKLKVSFILKNVCHYYEILMFLSANIPLTSFSIICGKKVDQPRSTLYRKTLSLLIKNFCTILESVNLQLQNNTEILDDILLGFMYTCPRLKHLDFHGIIGSIELVRSICYRQICTNTDLKYFTICPKNVTEEHHWLFNQIYVDYGYIMNEKEILFKIINCNFNHTNMVYVYY